MLYFMHQNRKTFIDMSLGNNGIFECIDFISNTQV